MKKLFSLLLLIPMLSCQSKTSKSDWVVYPPESYMQKLDTATFAGGCFWCIEASFDQIKGVVQAVSGYSGGKASNAQYKLVSYGTTGHAETVQVYYDPEKVDYETLLDIFFTAHDPTQLNRQGPDVGTQYRTAIFYHNEDQLKKAKAKIEALQADYSEPIVTELNPYKAFYPAEDYHQDYEVNHPFNPYIMNVSKPKVEKVKEKFKEQLKDEH